jgi:hypothetical protein
VHICERQNIVRVERLVPADSQDQFASCAPAKDDLQVNVRGDRRGVWPGYPSPERAADVAATRNPPGPAVARGQRP